MNKIKNMVIILLSVAVLGLSCYLIYDKTLSNKNNKSEQGQNESEEEIKNSLVSIIRKYKLDALHYEEDTIKFTDVPTNGQLYIAYLYNVDIQNDTYEDMDTTVNKNKMNDYFKTVYGITPTKYKDILCGVEKEALVYYREKSDNFVQNDNHPGHGYYGSGFLDYYITDYKKEDNNYIINLLFMDANQMDGYTVNEISDNNFDNELLDNESNDKIKEYFQNHIDDYKNIPRYQYTFTKEDGNYYLTEFKIVK